MEELTYHDVTSKTYPVKRRTPNMIKKSVKKTSVGRHITKRCRRILVVDDEKNIQDVLTLLLSTMGYEVVSASCGHEGLSLFLKNSIELVLTDLNMPGMDGLTLASHIKKKSPVTPVVLVTGSGKGEINEKLKRSCVDSVVFKPFLLEDLRKTVQEMIHHKELA